MFCPQCGQERVSSETNYCSRCGFLLTAVGDLLYTGGISPRGTQTSRSDSPRKRGLKQGLFMFLLTFLFVPLAGMISLALNVEPIAAGITAVFFFIGGLLRMVYAVMFESGDPGAPTLEEKALAGVAAFRSSRTSQEALPPRTTEPAAMFIPPASGNWRDTNDLQPTSVTENTTRLLEPDDASQ